MGKTSAEVKVIIRNNKAMDVVKSVKNTMPNLMTIIALDILGEAVDRCPIDTGRLINSLNYEADAKHAIIGTNVEYAPYVEFGTKNMDAQPYLRPAFDSTKKKLLATYNIKLKGAISEAIKK